MPAGPGSDADLPGDRAAGAAPLHRGRRGRPRGTRRRSPGSCACSPAEGPRRARRSRSTSCRGFRATTSASPGSASRVPRLVPPAPAGGQALPARSSPGRPAQAGPGRGVSGRGFPGPAPQGINRTRRARGRRVDDGRRHRVAAGDGEGGPGVRADVSPVLARADRSQRARVPCSGPTGSGRRRGRLSLPPAVADQADRWSAGIGPGTGAGLARPFPRSTSTRSEPGLPRTQLDPGTALACFFSGASRCDASR